MAKKIRARDHFRGMTSGTIRIRVAKAVRQLQEFHEFPESGESHDKAMKILDEVTQGLSERSSQFVKDEVSGNFRIHRARIGNSSSFPLFPQSDTRRRSDEIAPRDDIARYTVFKNE